MRVTHLPILFAGLCAVQPAFAAKKSKAAQNECEKPNVIFIYADDMGKGILSAYGQKYIDTPNIDRIINQGVQFNRAYGCHYSAPARASLLTGYSDVHKGHWRKEQGGLMIVADTAEIAPIEKMLNDRDVSLAADDEYLPQIFKKAGYVTGQIGKLEYGFCSSRQQVKSHGWDYFYGFMDHGRCHGFYPPFLFENDDIVMIDGNTHANCADAGYNYETEESYKWRLDMTGKKQYSQFLFDDKIADFIDEHKDEPFFLYHPSQLPHGAVSVPYIHESVKYKPNLTPVEKEYATMVILLDESVGKILDKLDEAGIADNTMIIFSVDNGHEVYSESEGRTTDGKTTLGGQKIDNTTLKYNSVNSGDIFNGNMNMSGKKRSNLQGGVCVPLTYYFPGKFEPRECNDVVANYDMIATMADMLNVSINPNKEAVSYYPLLTDPMAHHDEKHYALVDSREGPALIMNNGWKLRYSNITSKYELYHITFDHAEEHDMAAQFPEKVEEMRAILVSKVKHTECQGDYEGIKKPAPKKKK